jgi:hypothetical protein
VGAGTRWEPGCRIMKLLWEGRQCLSRRFPNGPLAGRNTWCRTDKRVTHRQAPSVSRRASISSKPADVGFPPTASC